MDNQVECAYRLCRIRLQKLVSFLSVAFAYRRLNVANADISLEQSAENAVSWHL